MKCRHFSRDFSNIWKSGEGIAFERVAHEWIYQTLQKGEVITAEHLCERGRGQKKHNFEISHQLKRKVFIRKIEDIRLLTPYEDYGIPVIPNFPLIDAVIGPNLFLQMTVSYSHEGAVSKLPHILTELRNMNSSNETLGPSMVFVLGPSNFTGFKKVKSLAIDQYKLQCSCDHASRKRAAESNENESKVKKDEENRREESEVLWKSCKLDQCKPYRY